MSLNLYGLAYRLLMRLAHRFHWHHAPPIYPDGDTQLWCQWCGFRQTIKRLDRAAILQSNGTAESLKADRV